MRIIKYGKRVEYEEEEERNETAVSEKQDKE